MAMKKCGFRRSKKRRVQINLTIDPTLISRIRKLMGELEETSLSNFTEGLFDCVLRDDCVGCPTFEELPEEEKAEIEGKVGVGKQTVK